MANLLAVVALGRSWATFKDAGRAGFPSGMKVSVGQEPSCITAFGQPCEAQYDSQSLRGDSMPPNHVAQQ
jgi:hypothetical protein